MPRVHINKKKYMISDFRVWVIGKMNVLGKSQADMGNLLGISQPAFGKRLKESNFDYSQIITIFKELQATDEDIVKFMKLQKGVRRNVQKRSNSNVRKWNVAHEHV